MDDGKKQTLKRHLLGDESPYLPEQRARPKRLLPKPTTDTVISWKLKVTVTQTYLYITVSHKTAEEMAAQYGFNEEQKELAR